MFVKRGLTSSNSGIYTLSTGLIAQPWHRSSVKVPLIRQSPVPAESGRSGVIVYPCGTDCVCGACTM